MVLDVGPCSRSKKENMMATQQEGIRLMRLPRALCPGHCDLFQDIRGGSLMSLLLPQEVLGVLNCLRHSQGLWYASCLQVELSCGLFASILTDSSLATLLGLMGGNNGCQGEEGWIKRERPWEVVRGGED